MDTSDRYVIEFTSSKVEKNYLGLPQDEKRRIDRAFQELSKFPFRSPSRHIRKLRGKWAGHYRWDINSMRIIYTIDNVRKTVYIERIEHRKDAYR
ncbi:MAG: type II toxin-antitoxin system RelE/ParE family toxin [Syntrophothermus sp.]|uniref:type II toxin-antitoxin system RelE family toxin n=1 Tax=Syntrophothermus sp. TaxID=2736299 RepID=UPI00257A48E5|nr:type II toxin-antitoxin system RelE/ParE family toxin [Syntrophothermus sp.]NSW83100.1 type II toxin-antitoxin system RelE/ParE family toxin [Syntrophothermus sp.]